MYNIIVIIQTFELLFLICFSGNNSKEVLNLRVLCDVDGIINTLPEAVLEVYNEDWNDNLTIKDIREYHIEKFVKPEARDEFYKYFTDKRVWKRIKPINVEAVQWLIDHTDFYFCTSTEPYNLYKKERWINRNFTNIDTRKQLIRCHRKQLIQADILIDDCANNLMNGSYVGVCIAYPYNADYIGLRFSSVAQFVNWQFGNEIGLNIKPGQSKK